jgi:hypothetical protein
MANKIASYSQPIVAMAKECVNQAYETTLTEGVSSLSLPFSHLNIISLLSILSDMEFVYLFACVCVRVCVKVSNSSAECFIQRLRRRIKKKEWKRSLRRRPHNGNINNFVVFFLSRVIPHKRERRKMSKCVKRRQKTRRWNFVEQPNLCCAVLQHHLIVCVCVLLHPHPPTLSPLCPFFFMKLFFIVAYTTLDSL